MTSARMPLVKSLVVALLVLPVARSVSAKPPAHHVVSIAEARSLPIGTVVTVDGSVTTPSGAFASSFFDQGFGLQDASGGIFVSLQTDLGVAPRAQARVTGALQDSFGLLILVPAADSDVKVHGRGPTVDAKPVATGDVGEETEGLLVRVRGTIVQAPSSDLPFGHKFTVNDGSGELQIFINVDTGIDTTVLRAGEHVSVVGFSSQFEDHYEIDPRSPGDIRTHGD